MHQKFLYSVIILLFTAFFYWLYYPAAGSYFANDDWILLYHTKLIPPAQPWKYFSMHAIWFYRPLQTMQYGLTWHLAGMNHLAYSLQLLIMHFGVCALVWVLLRSLFGTGIATFATLFFSVSCLSPDIITWFPNVNTSQHALTTLFSACCFVYYLKSNRLLWLWGAIGAAVINCFTKESCVNLPLILGTVWITLYLQGRWSPFTSEPADNDQPISASRFSGNLPAVSLQFIKDLSPFAVITMVYALCHTLFFVNIESWYAPAYGFMSPLKAIGQLLHSINFALFGLVTYPLSFGATPLLGAFTDNLLLYGYIFPVILIALAIWKKCPTVIFAILFAASLQFPTFALEHYFEGRYFYLAATSGALLLSSMFLPPFKLLIAAILNHVNNQQNESRVAFTFLQRLYGYFAVIITAGVLAENIVAFQWVIGARCQEGVFVEQAFKYIRKEGGKLPKNSLVVLRLNPNNFFRRGLGVSEMIALATNRKDLLGITTDAAIPDAMRSRVISITDKYLLEIFTVDPQFQKVDHLKFPEKKSYSDPEVLAPES